MVRFSAIALVAFSAALLRGLTVGEYDYRIKMGSKLPVAATGAWFDTVLSTYGAAVKFHTAQYFHAKYQISEEE